MSTLCTRRKNISDNPEQFVFFDDGAKYNGKIIDLTEKIAGVTEGLKECKSFQSVVVIKRFDAPCDTSSIANTERLEAFLGPSRETTPPPIVRVGFQDPLVVYYSSGTTGTPKAIVHGVGPILLSSKKDGVLHRDVKPNQTALQYTTTGWIMYLGSIMHLLIGGHAILYDGSPFAPDLKVLLRVIEQQKVNILGISPRWLGELMKNRIVPKDEVDLSTLKRVTSTGMVLPDQTFEWFYDVAFPKQTQLCNFTGGTDIVSFFICNCIQDEH